VSLEIEILFRPCCYRDFHLAEPSKVQILNTLFVKKHLVIAPKVCLSVFEECWLAAIAT
jgi:hypothetical protein